MIVEKLFYLKLFCKIISFEIKSFLDVPQNYYIKK